MEINIKFSGGDADQHRIPAHDGSVALEGLSRSIILISHFLIEGKIRKRAPFTDEARVYLTHTKPGSFETIFDLVIQNPGIAVLGGAAGTVAIGVITNLTTDLTKYIFKKLTGKEQELETPEGKSLNETRGGDIEALADAVEPSLSRVHNIINNGVININISQGPNPIAQLNAATKRYIQTTVLDPTPQHKQCSVGSYNANSRYGRVYDSEFGKTVPFLISSDAESRTSSNIAESLQRYASKNLDSYINIKYLISADLDGRVKRYLILDAWFDD
jgi:hypothetical protein